MPSGTRTRLVALTVMALVALPAAYITGHVGWITAAVVVAVVATHLITRERASDRSSTHGP